MESHSLHWKKLVPTYEYVCRNEDCENEDRLERNCSISERNNLPKCPKCYGEMGRSFTQAPLVNWRYLSANGVMKTSSMGPCQRADRRLQKYVNGQPIWRPIHKSVEKNMKKEKK